VDLTSSFPPLGYLTTLNKDSRQKTRRHNTSKRNEEKKKKKKNITKNLRLLSTKSLTNYFPKHKFKKSRKWYLDPKKEVA